MRRTLVIFATILALTSCGNVVRSLPEKVGLVSIESISGSFRDTLTLGLVVRNASGYRIGVEDGACVIRSESGTIGTASMVGPVLLEKGDSVHVICRLKLDLDNPLAALSAVSGIVSGRVSGLTVDLSAMVKVSGFRRRIEKRNVPMERITRNIGRK